MPAQEAFIGTPASNSDREPPQTEAIELEPLDSQISLTTRRVYGNSSTGGSKAARARRASAP